MTKTVPSPTFLSYQPVALAFGTSGLRGLVKDITDLEAYINVKGTLRYLVERGDLRLPSRVVLGGDLRPSTERMMRACARAITDCGAEVEHAGRIPTPALVLRSLAAHIPGVMVTGSHIPFDRNGIKVNKSTGEILKSDEPGILAEVERVRREEYARDAAGSAFDEHGMLRDAPALGPVDGAAREGYVHRYLHYFESGALSGVRVLAWQHSAVGRDLLIELLRALGAEVIPVGRAEAFVPIDTENVTAEQLDRLEQFVLEFEGDRAIDAIISTDGDSDRPLVCAVRTRQQAAGRRRVRFLGGDLLGIVVAEALDAGAAVVPISANDAVEQRLRERGVVFRKSRIGSPFVIAGMDTLKGDAATWKGPIVGWEANGGFLLGSAVDTNGRSLSPLPTRDAMLPLLVNLHAAVKAKITLEALWDRLPARFGSAGLIDEVPVAVSRAILAGVIPDGPSNEDGDMMIDPRSREIITRFFTAQDGFDEPVAINALDGARIRFKNGDVAHIRPSGNAPQLRAYSNASTQERADAIVATMLREPDGILRKMQSALG